jgi:hypothetical protein
MELPDEDQPINLEESSFHELRRAVVRVDEDEEDSSSTRTPEMPPQQHAKTDARELLQQPFGKDASSA